MKKVIKALILICVLSLLCCAVALYTSASTAEETPQMSIDKYSLSMRDNVCIKFAVKINGVENADDVKLLVWKTPKESYVYEGTENTDTYTVLENVGYQIISEEKYYIYDYTGLSAKEMGTYVYAVAYTEQGGVAYYSDFAKYSILEYAYAMLGKTGTSAGTAELQALMKTMLDYGSASQTYFHKDGEPEPILVNTPHYQVNVVGGTVIADNSTSGLYPSTTRIEITAPATDTQGIPFSHWTNKAGDVLSAENEYAFVVGKENEIYTAVYDSVAHTPDVGGALAYTVIDENTCYISGLGDYKGNEVVIPKYIDVYTVVGITENAFADTPIISITVPETVTSIGYGAFRGCTGLTEITIPSSVTELGYDLFGGADNLKTVYYNTSHGTNNGIFSGSSVEKVVFGGSSIPSYICEYTDVKEIVITNNVTSIGEYAFANCDSLESVYYNVISHNDFEYTTDCVFVNSGTESGGFKLTVGKDVKRIPSYMFHDYYDGNELTINLISVEFEEGSVCESIGRGAFFKCTKLTNIILGYNVKTIEDNAFIYCESLTSITLGNSLETIGNSAFSESGITSIVIPANVTKIGYYAFWYCEDLTGIIFENTSGWTSLGEPFDVTDAAANAQKLAYGWDAINDGNYTAEALTRE